MLPYIDQLDKKSTNAMKSAAASETFVKNVGWTSGLEKDSNSTLHFQPMPSHTGRTLGIVGNSRDGEGLEDWRRSALELDPRVR